MIAKVRSSYVYGIEALPVEVEVDVGKGLPSFSIVGLPDTACRESQDRVRSALRNMGFQFPTRKIVVNLAPADVKKEGSSFDLPIAIGILIASGQMEEDWAKNSVMSGELSLDGRLRRVSGILPRAASLSASGCRFVFPHDNLREASCVEKLALLPAKTLKEAVDRLVSGQENVCPVQSPLSPERTPRYAHDFADVKGQAFARRGIEVAAAGGHNLLLIGPPGAGKTMLAKRLPSILTDLSFEESLETTKIHSVAGCLKKKDSLILTRPFRTPHHSISDVAMVGGGAYPKPGEISLAHNGVLFLDELPEFKRNVLEVLRQPLEDGRIIISRAAQSIAFPAHFILVAAMNPCPCGYFTDERKECYCTPLQIKNYMGKISGPLLDRIDMHLEVAALRTHDFNGRTQPECSESIRKRVVEARRLQEARYSGPVRLNAQLEGKDVEEYCQSTDEARSFLLKAMEELGFSGRAYHKTLKVARTLADLENKPLIELEHIQEAVHYRALDRRIWFGA